MRHPAFLLVLSAGVNKQLSSIELTGLGAGQAEDWQYTYLQARMRKGNFFAQTFANFSESGETFLLRTGMPIVDESYVWAAQAQNANSIGSRELLTYGVDYQHTVPRTEGTITGRNEDDGTQPEIDRTDPRFAEILEPEDVADLALEGLAAGRFLVLPHPRVGESFRRKAGDHDRWLDGTNRRIRRIRGDDG